jgi:PAS domain S-box-containing protein
MEAARVTQGTNAGPGTGANESVLARSGNVVFAGSGEMRARCRAIDWASTPLGPVDGWSQALRITVRTLLASRIPMFLWWGPELVQIYNDAYRPSLGVSGRHPEALGAQARESWTDIWGAIGPEVAHVMATGEATWHEDQYLPIERNGRLEDVWWTYSYSPVHDDDGSIAGTLVVCQETTSSVIAEGERERLLAALGAERTLLRTVLDQLPVAVFVVEAPSGKVLALNAAVARIWGESRPHTNAVDSDSAEWMGCHVDGRRVALDEWPIARAARFGETIVDWMGEIERTDGSHAMIEVSAAPVRDADGQIVAAVAVATDVTTRVQAERDQARLMRELVVERTRLADVFQQAPAFLAVVRGPAHVFELANDAYYQLVGHRDLIGRPAIEALPEVREQGFIETLDRVLATGEPVVGREVSIRLARTPGAPPEERFVDFVYQTLVEEDGTRSGVAAHGSDVTAHVIARREIERLLAESEQARIEGERARSAAESARAIAEAADSAKSRFLANMSHELRTPLNAIQGYAQLIDLGLHGPVTDAQHSALTRIDRAQRHLLGLVNDVLNFASLGAGRVEYDVREVLVANVVADVLPLVEPQLAAKGIGVEVHLPEVGPAGPTGRAPIPVWADREKLGQIFLNLLSNAIKFTPPGGRVNIDLVTRSDGSGPPHHAYFRVADTGIGIPTDKLEAVFQPFVQVRTDYARESGGTGLGLAISRDLARGMGGDLRVRSTEGIGSVFTITLGRVLPDEQPGRSGATDHHPVD